MINAAQIHLVLNHLPVIIPLVGIPILVVGLYLKSGPVRNVGLALLVVSGLVAIPAYLTGEPAETLIKNYPGISRQIIHEHEEAAAYALTSIEAMAVVSLFIFVGLYLKKQIPKVVWIVLIFMSLFALVVMMRTAHLGGEIRHEEIRSEIFAPEMK